MITPAHLSRRRLHLSVELGAALISAVILFAALGVPSSARGCSASCAVDIGPGGSSSAR